VEEPLEELLADGCDCALELFTLLFDTVRVLPGNAWAATSESTAVRATVPAISQRLMRESLRRAASRTVISGFPFIRGVWLRSIRAF
jgi:hypothetical protein